MDLLVDIMRSVAIAMIFVSIGFLLGWVYRVARREQLPWCVWGLAVSYVLYAVSAAIELQLRIGTHITWRTPLVVVAALVGALVQVCAYITRPFERRRR